MPASQPTEPAANSTNDLSRGAMLFAKAARGSPGDECAARADTSNAAPSSAAAAPQVAALPSGGCPVVSENVGAGGASSSNSDGGCPVVTPDFDARNLMPKPSNDPAPGQVSSLDTKRAVSSIPIAAPELPAHQDPATGTWIYPSQQMFYNAMKRKGWDPKEQDMEQVVAIHNVVNERAWREVCKWEEQHCESCGGPRLRRFQGRPQDYSPKARLLNLLGYKLPFDRHDWIVDRCGKEVRYVIDFYNAAPLAGMPVAMHLDVRPALDSPGALWDRLRMQASWLHSGRWRREYGQ